MLLNADGVHINTLKSGSGAIWVVEVFRYRFLSGDVNDTLWHFEMVSGYVLIMIYECN
jgi:hypothetical protein